MPCSTHMWSGTTGPGSPAPRPRTLGPIRPFAEPDGRRLVDPPWEPTVLSGGFHCKMPLLGDPPPAKSPCTRPRREPQVRNGCAQMQNSENPRLLKCARPWRLHRGLILSASLFALGWPGAALAQEAPPPAAESGEEMPAADAQEDIA